MRTRSFRLRLAIFSALISGVILLAFGLAALVNYQLCVAFLFHRSVRWSRPVEWLVYAAVVAGIGMCDVFMTRSLVAEDFDPLMAKAIAAASLPILNFAARRYLVFATGGRGPWEPTYGG